MNSTNYGNRKLLDYLIAQFKVKNDAALARKLDVNASAISAIRNGDKPVGASLLIKAHEGLNMPTLELKKIMEGK